MAQSIAEKRLTLGEGSGDDVPDEIARALDASAEDLRVGRTEEIGTFLAEMRARLKAHLAEKAASSR